MENKEYLEVAPPGKYQTLKVDWRVPIREFVEDCRIKGHYLVFEPGRGFYEFTKPELIRETTQVVLRDKRTGEMLEGPATRRMIGLRPGERARVKPPRSEYYDIFVQSRSLKRKLVGGTELLYEIEPKEKGRA